MKTELKFSTAMFVVAALGAGGAPAFAQTAPADSASAVPSDIVVTATRREESINRVPLAIQALSGESLSRLNVTSFEKLVEYLPNAVFPSWGICDDYGDRYWGGHS